MIIVISVSSFQLYEFDSEPMHQLNLDRNFYKKMEAGCEYHSGNLAECRNYTVNCMSYNASFFMGNPSGFGGQSIMFTPYSEGFGFPTMRLYFSSCNTTGSYSYISFEITNVVGKLVNETCGNCTGSNWCDTIYTANYTFYRNSNYHRVDLSGLSFGSGLNYNYRYLHIPKYSKVHFPYRPINFTLYYSVTLVPIFHYHNLFTGYFTGKPITLVYDPNVVFTTLIPYYNCSTK